MFPAGRDPVFAGSHVQIAMKQNRHPALIANAGNLRDFSKLIRGIRQKAAGVGNAQALEPVAERVHRRSAVSVAQTVCHYEQCFWHVFINVCLFYNAVFWSVGVLDR